LKIKWNLQQVYFYLVCFVTLIIVIIGAVNTTRALIEFFIPVENHYYEKPYMERENLAELFPSEIVEQEINRQEDINQQNSRNETLKNIFRGISYLIVAVPVYLYHWKQIPYLEKK